MPLDKVLSSSIANGAVTAALISNTANLVVSSLTANVISITTISGSANVTGDMTVGGNLTISGTTTYVNTTDLNIGDAIISLNADLAANVSPTENAGLNINRGASTNAQFVWVESTDNWSLGNTTISGIFNANDTIITGTANVSTGINVGANVNLGTTYMDVGNSTVNTTITNITVSTNTVNVASIINIGANINLSTSQINIGNSTVNTVISAASLTTTSNTVSIGTAAYVVANGNFGIGTSSPAYKLDVNSDIKVVNAIRYFVGATQYGVTFANAGAVGTEAYQGTYIYWGTGASTSATERMRLDSSGNLGVGTTSPQTKLHVYQRTDAGAAPNTPEIRIEHQDINAIGTGGSNGSILSFVNIQRDNTAWANNSIWGRINFSGSQPTSGSAQLGASILAASDGVAGGLTSPTYMAFYTSDGSNGGNNVERLRLNSSGNLGLGATSPNTRLDIRSASSVSDSTRYNILVADTTAYATGVGGGINFGYVYDSSGSIMLRGTNIKGIKENGTDGNYASALAFSTTQNGASTAERMRIDSSGNLGIGSTAPANKLDVRGILGIGTAGTSSLNSFTIQSVNTSAQNHTHTFSGPSAGTNDTLGFYLNRGGGSYGEFFVSFYGTYRFFVPGSTLNNNGDAYIMPPRYLGIGTTSPSYILDVNGMARVTGLQNTNLYSYNMIGTYTGSTWYAITDGGTMAQPGVYICVMYVDSYNIGGSVYYYTFASVPFYWTGNTVGSNGTYAQVLPTMYGTGHALNSQTPPSLRIIERTSGLTPQLQFSLPFTLTYSGTAGSTLIFNFTKIA